MLSGDHYKGEKEGSRECWGRIHNFRYGGLFKERSKSHYGSRGERDSSGRWSCVNWQQVGHANSYRLGYGFGSYSRKKQEAMERYKQERSMIMSTYEKIYCKNWLWGCMLEAGRPVRMLFQEKSEQMAAWTKVDILEGFGKLLRGENQQDLVIGQMWGVVNYFFLEKKKHKNKRNILGAQSGMWPISKPIILGILD